MTEAEAAPFSEFDHYDRSRSAAEVRELYADMRETCPVSHSSKYGGFDMVNRYAEVREVLTGGAAFSSADGVFIPPTGLPRTPALEFEGPAHKVWRTLMNPPLTPRAVRAFESTILDVADSLIDAFAARGHADLVEELAEPMPSIVIGRIIGLDAERSREGRAVAARLYSTTGTDAFADALAAFRAFVERNLDDRREHPRDDFLTQIASGEIEGLSIDSDGAFGLMMAYVLGGHHSTGSGIAGLLHHLLTVPGLKDEVQADPARMRPAVEESLRLNTPLQLFARTACEGARAGATAFEAGDRLMVNLAAANRDPRQFEDAEEFRLDRSRNPHVAFGAGAHVCLGQELARAELRIVANRLLERLPDLRLDGEVRELVINAKLMMMESLPVTFEPESQ